MRKGRRLGAGLPAAEKTGDGDEVEGEEGGGRKDKDASIAGPLGGRCERVELEVADQSHEEDGEDGWRGGCCSGRHVEVTMRRTGVEKGEEKTRLGAWERDGSGDWSRTKGLLECLGKASGWLRSEGERGEGGDKDEIEIMGRSVHLEWT
jgi:hypothetical protein